MGKYIKIDIRLIWYKTAGLFVWTPVLFIVLMLLLFAVFQIPKIQTDMINSATKYISQNTSFSIHVESANLTWYDKMVLKNIRVYEHENDSTMISIGDAQVHISLFDLFLKKEINASILEVKSPFVHITKHNDSTELNISKFTREMKELFKRENKQKKKPKIYVKRIEIVDGVFSFNDIRRDSLQQGKDYYHFQYDSITATVSDFTLASDSIGFQIDRLRGDDHVNQLNIKSLYGLFYLTPKQLSLYEFKLNTDRSIIRDSLVFKYRTTANFAYFNDSINFYSHFKNSTIDSRDIGLFNQTLSNYNRQINLSGYAYGSVKRLHTKKIQLKFGNHSTYQGNASFFGLPLIRETFMDIDFVHSTMDPNDVIDIIDIKEETRLNDMLIMNMNGNFTGFLTDFVANGLFTSEAGKVTTDINFKIDKQNVANYSGHLELENYDLRQILGNNTAFKKIKLNGEINGHGLEVEDAYFQLNARVDSIQYKDYTYTDIDTEGLFEEEYFKGNLQIDDPNLRFDGYLDIDIRNKVNKFTIDAQLDTMRLDILGFSKHPLSISSTIDIDMKGLKEEDLIGYLNLYNSAIYYKKDSLIIDSLNILSSKIADQRLIHTETEGFTGQIRGDFTIRKLHKSLQYFYDEVVLNLENNSETISQYYNNKTSDSTDYVQANLDINFWDINKFITPFIPNFSLSQNVQFTGELKQDSIFNLNLNSSFDTLHLDENQFFGNVIDLSLSKPTDNNDMIASIFSESAAQYWFNEYQTEDIYLDTRWDKDQIQILSNFNQKEYGNEIELNASFDFSTDQIKIHFNPSRIMILDNQWIWNQDNFIIYDNDQWEFSDFQLSNGSEYLSINGKYSYSHAETLSIGINNFELENLQPVYKTSYKGLLDAKLNIKRREGENLVEGDIKAHGVFIDDFHVGHIFGLSTWDNRKNRLNVNLSVVKNDLKKMDVTGHIYPDRLDHQLDLTAKFRHADLQLLEPYIKANFENIKGYAVGNIDIGGNIKSPILKGKATIQEGHSSIKYLKTEYDFNGDISFTESEIIAQNLTLIDSEQNKASVTGKVTHENFKNFNLNLRGNFRNFQLLNTTSTDNNTYYGNAYATGYVTFSGTLDNIILGVQAKSTRGTHISIPVGGFYDNTAKQKEYIQFVDLTQPEEIKNLEAIIQKEVESAKIKGIEMDFDLEMTKDAYLELIFDVKAGDIIRGRGNGNIKLQINTDGDFNIFGDYIIDNGGYNFTLYNIINKEFNIKKGSSIAWYGDPYKAILNIDAEYRQLASLLPILEPSISNEDDQNTSQVRKKYPSIVNLKLTEKLFEPKIKFGISIEDYPQNITLLSKNDLDIEGLINAFKVKLAGNEQEMNRQVFSLLILRRFSPENSFQVNNSNTIGSSLSEFVSNQLSYWATQVDENLEIDVDLAGLTDDEYNTFQLRLSYTFLDGRLRVTRGGALPNDQTKNDVTAIIGDWTVEYLLTPDGRLRIKMYSRTDQDNFNKETGNSGMETGLSLQSIRNFNEFNELLNSSRKKEQKRRAKENKELNKDLKKEEEDLELEKSS
ncbi:MAG: translocation/assembly module TamB domain-containing protein [Reichenbachiella sp.]